MAVYTHVTDSDIHQFLCDYDIGKLSFFSGIAEGVENSNFLLQTTTNRYILTLYEKRVNPIDIPFFLKLLTHLAKHGISCPIPVKGNDGNALRKLKNRPAAIVTFLDGSWPRIPNSWHCRALGAAMAQMHHCGKNFPLTRKNSLTIGDWRPLLEACQLTKKEIYIALYNELNQELGWLERNWPKDLPTGIIHADLFPDNVFFQNRELSGIIDFYFACTDFLAYDLAICINAWCLNDDGILSAEKSRSMISAYQKVRPLLPEEVTALPILARGSALRFLLTRLYDWLNHPEGALVKPKDPMSYLKKLRFHQNVSNISAYGIMK
ncbi:MAG: homoserine kinase [Rhodospirillaceae bacterium]|nr:homoserine kinase [Rhodospirillaceae bacterium]|tara:strand:- start:936 stop:1901 length:966 start_codon:yes stop_codon:yes gene_type:complete